MKKKFIICLLVALPFTVSCQEYNTGLGFRGGGLSGITIKHFVSDINAIEGILHLWGYGFGATGLFEVHALAFNTTGLYWYYGGGVGIASWSGRYWNEYSDNYFALGIDGIVGIEYNIQEIPINIGVDFKPRLNIIGDFGFYPDGAISVRYLFREE